MILSVGETSAKNINITLNVALTLILQYGKGVGGNNSKETASITLTLALTAILHDYSRNV